MRELVTVKDLNTSIPVCTPGANAEQSTSETRVAVVRSRVGRAPYDEAFVLEPGREVPLGSHVRVDRASCVLQATLEPGAACRTRDGAQPYRCAAI